MTAIILVWNPDEWNGWTYPDVVEEVAATGWHLATWELGSPTFGSPEFGSGELGQAAAAGAEAWLVLHDRHGAGLIGHGVIVSERPAGLPGSVRVAFDSLLPAGDQIPPAVLQEAVPGIGWDALHGSGIPVDPSAEPLLRGLWREYGPQPLSNPTQSDPTQSDPTQSDPTLCVPGTVPAAALSRVQVNRYEHNPDARRACVAHHGTSCAACGFSFEVAYGEIGKDFIPVHHLVPASQLGGGYQLDPVADLVPLCANCHAMAHYGVTTPRTVAELRRIMASAGYLAGQTVTEEQLQAQRDARRILDQH